MQLLETFRTGTPLDKSDLVLRDSDLQQLLLQCLGGESRKFVQLHVHEETYQAYRMAA